MRAAGGVDKPTITSGGAVIGLLGAPLVLVIT